MAIIKKKVGVMINLRNISHVFGNNRALDDVSIKVEKGETLALLGENGAGKTTLMRICASYIRPKVGEVLIEGINIADNPKEARRKIGYMPEGAPLYSDMSVKAFLRFISEVKGVSLSAVSSEIERVACLAGLNDVMDKDIGVLSKGYRRRVALAATVTSDPDILLLDEPAEGLDPNQKFDFKSCLKEMNKAVIVSTHVLEDIKGLADRMVILHKGRVKYQKRISDLKDVDLNKLFREQTK